MKIYEANGNRFILGEEMVDVKEQCKQYLCDGFLLIHSHQMNVYNADGSQAELCLNGLHCFAHYLYDQHPEYRVYALLIGSEIYKCEILQVDPFISEVELKLPKIYRNFVDTGNEHYILFENDLSQAELLSKRYDCNVSYVKIINRKYIEVKTYERGVGFTKSCGSGNVASCYYCKFNGLCDDFVEVLNPGGVSSIQMKEKILVRTPSHQVMVDENHL